MIKLISKEKSDSKTKRRYNLEEFNLKTQFVEFKSNGHLKDILKTMKFL